MPDTLTEPEVKDELEIELEGLESTEPSETPYLDAAMDTMRQLTTTSGNVYVPADTVEEEIPEDVVEEVVEPPVPDLDFLLKDPKVGPQIQSQLDKRADALEKSRADRYRERVAAEEAAKAKADALKAQEDYYAEQVQKADSNDFNESETAKAELVRLNKERLVRQKWEKEVLPELREREVNTVLNAKINQLDTAYNTAYSKIPEIRDNPTLAGLVHHSGFSDPTEWLSTLTDKVSEARVSSLRSELEASIRADLKKEADAEVEARVSQRMAEARSRMPRTEVRTSTPEGRENATQYHTEVEYEAAFAEGKIGIGQLRAYRNMKLPYS